MAPVKVGDGYQVCNLWTDIIGLQIFNLHLDIHRQL